MDVGKTRFQSQDFRLRPKGLPHDGISVALAVAVAAAAAATTATATAGPLDCPVPGLGHFWGPLGLELVSGRRLVPNLAAPQLPVAPHGFAWLLLGTLGTP